VNVALPLKVARRLVDDPQHDRARLELRKAIARAEALLVPRPWQRWGGADGKPFIDREWPRGDNIAARVSSTGWFVQRRDEFEPFASGPETGELGQRKADEALAAYVKRQGVKLPPEWFGR
jgi:hypothetical protein